MELKKLIRDRMRPIFSAYPPEKDIDLNELIEIYVIDEA